MEQKQIALLCGVSLKQVREAYRTGDFDELWQGVIKQNESREAEAARLREEGNFQYRKSQEIQAICARLRELLRRALPTMSVLTAMSALMNYDEYIALVKEIQAELAKEG